MEANLFRAVRAMVPSVKAVRVPGPFTCYVSIEQRARSAKQIEQFVAMGEEVSDEMRALIADQWPELLAKIVPARKH